MRWATQRTGIHPFAVLCWGLASLAAGACASTASVGTPDTGSVTPHGDATTSSGPDSGDATIFPQPDVMSIFGGDTGTDATTPMDSTVHNDAPSSMDGGHDGSSGSGSGTGSGSDSGSSPDTGTGTGTGTGSTDGGCMAVSVPTSTAGAIKCAAPVTGTCGPGTLSGFSATAPAPTGAHQNKCTAQQITDVYNGCLNGGTCPPTSDPTSDCTNCILTQQEASSWGPVVTTPGTMGLASINYGGCLALLEPCNSACADALENDLQCEYASCGTNCPVATQADVNAYESCAETIDNCDANGGPNGCFVYYNGGSVCQSEITGSAHPGSACFVNFPNFEDGFTAVATVFCGP